MKEFKLVFPKIDQSYSFIDLQKTVKGNVKQITGNIVTVLLNPKYCKAKKIYEGQIFYDKFTNEIKFQGKIIGEKGIKLNQVRLWDYSLDNRLGLEIEKHFGLNYNSNKMWDAVRSSKTKRISPSGISIPVKLYYEREEKIEEFTEVVTKDLPKEWQESEQIKIGTGENEKEKEKL